MQRGNNDEHDDKIGDPRRWPPEDPTGHELESIVTASPFAKSRTSTREWHNADPILAHARFNPSTCYYGHYDLCIVTFPFCYLLAVLSLKDRVLVAQFEILDHRLSLSLSCSVCGSRLLINRFVVLFTSLQRLVPP